MALSYGSCYIDITYKWMSDGSKCGVVFLNALRIAVSAFKKTIFFLFRPHVEIDGCRSGIEKKIIEY